MYQTVEIHNNNSDRKELRGRLRKTKESISESQAMVEICYFQTRYSQMWVQSGYETWRPCIQTLREAETQNGQVDIHVCICTSIHACNLCVVGLLLGSEKKKYLLHHFTITANLEVNKQSSDLRRLFDFIS